MRRNSIRTIRLAAVIGAVLFAGQTARADWATHRGNAERTGNDDGQAGPQAPKVRWVYKAPEHFIAAPVPAAGALYVSGLGAFNTAQFHALSLDGDAPDRVLWSKSAPFIKLPTVSSPAVVGGGAGALLVFGDGMHQTDGAALYCVNAATGRPVWQFDMDGKLVHMEGAPVVADNRVYIGAGDGGVLCVDLRRATLDGKELDAAEIQKRMDAKWADLMATYKKAKQTDPDFAVAPGDDALPKAAPKTLWHVKDKGWHVDAALSVVKGKVLVASAYIDFDKVGKRVVACLDAATGKVLWETPVDLNPWAGATVVGDQVIVGCSNIRFDAKLLPEAKGQVVSLDLNSGKLKWKRDLPGAVLAAVAVKGDVAVCTATDGKVRGLNAADGNVRWEYAAGAPFFAGPAVAGDAVYAADLKGVVYAVALADGKKKWTMDVTADPSVQAPGMVFGSPVVHGGEIFLATCNVEGDHAEMPTVVVCVSDKAPSGGAKSIAKIEVDTAARTVRVPCKIGPRKLPNLKEIYPLEVVATYPPPLGQKAHETVVNFDVKPSEVHKALAEALGLTPGKPSRSEEGTGTGPEVELFLEVPGLGGKPIRVPMEKAMIDKRTGRPMPHIKWMFTGSVLRQPDPNKPTKVYAADLTGTLIAIFPVTDETVIQSSLTNPDSSIVKLEVNHNLIPEEGADAVLIIRAK
jgi:outer membrane protein assembly factor BamB